MPEDQSTSGDIPETEAEFLAGLRPSRIREVQGGDVAWTSVDIIDCDGQGPAMRAMLEEFGVQVTMWRVGQARHLQAAFDGARAPYLILACHGDEGTLLLGELAPEVQRWQPYGPAVSAADIAEHVAIAAHTVIATGCDTGDPRLAEAFLSAGADAYLAPTGGPFGYASVFAPVFIFYELVEKRSFAAAVARLQQHDDELSCWQLTTRPFTSS